MNNVVRLNKIGLYNELMKVKYQSDYKLNCILNVLIKKNALLNKKSIIAEIDHFTGSLYPDFMSSSTPENLSNIWILLLVSEYVTYF